MLIQIQPSMHPDFFTPYPFVIAEDGDVEGQDFWKGDPAVLVGFQDRFDVKLINLFPEDWWAEPQRAVNKYPVFTRADSTIYVSQVAIAEVTVFPDLHPAVITINPQDRGLDLVRGSNTSTVIGRVWWDNDRDTPGYTLRVGATETSHDSVDTITAALRDAGYMLERSSRGQIADLADVMTLPHIAALAKTADEAREETRLAGLNHARSQHALALEILRTRWPDAAAVEADLSMHLALEGNPQITRILGADGTTVHTVVYSEDVLDLAQEALAIALDFTNEQAAGWDGPQPRRSDETEIGGDRFVYTLTLTLT